MLARGEDGCSWIEKQEPECLWFHGWLAAPWGGAVLLWKKAARFQKVLEVEIILNSCLSGSYFSVTLLSLSAEVEPVCVCQVPEQGRVSAAKGDALATLLLPLSRALKFWYSWAWVQEVAQPGLRVWIQDQFLLPISALIGCWY